MWMFLPPLDKCQVAVHWLSNVLQLPGVDSTVHLTRSAGGGGGVY